MILKADKDKVTLSNWLLLSGEFNVRTITVELSDELLACSVCLLKVTLNDGSVIDSPIKDGKVEFPCILKSQQIIIGVTAYDTDDNGDLEQRYSPEPCYYYVPLGSFTKIGKEQGYLSPGAYSEVLGKLKQFEEEEAERQSIFESNEAKRQKGVVTYGVNLFNKNSAKIEDDVYISSNGSYTADANKRHFLTHPIAVENGKTYTTLWNAKQMGAAAKLWLYSSDIANASEHIGSSNVIGLDTSIDEFIEVTFTINNTDAKFVRFNCLKSKKDSLMFVEGLTYPEEYQEYGVSLNEDISIPQLKNYIPSANVGDYVPYDDISDLQDNVIRLENGNVFPKWEIGRLSTTTGLDVIATNGIRTVGYIELQKYGSIKIIGNSLTVYLIEYDENKNLLTSSSGSNKVLTPTNDACKFVRICSYKSGDVVTDTMVHSEKISVYYDGFSLEYLNEKVKEIDKNNIRYSYGFNNIPLKSINHRGYNTIAPENTLPAYRLSKQKGFKFVECDVTLTSDKVPVLLHDDTIDRTSNGTGNVNELTLEHLKSLDFGSWKSETYAGTEIPTFEEFIILCRDLGLYPYIEMKNSTTFSQNDIDNIVNIVKKYGLEHCATYISNNRDVLKKVITSNKTARVGVLLNGNINSTFCNTTMNTLDTGVNEVFFDVGVAYATKSNLDIYEQYGFPVEVYCPNTEEIIFALDKRVVGITSDTLVAENVIREHNLGDSETGLIG